MTKQEAIDKLNALTGDDQESDHIDADRILVQMLNETEFKEVADAWNRADERVGFWYA